MDRKRTLAYAVLVLFLLFLIVAGLDQGTHFFNFRFFQFESPLYYLGILFLAIGAFCMFVLFAIFPPRTIPGRVLSAVKAVGISRNALSRLRHAEIQLELGNVAGAQRALHHIRPGDPGYPLARRALGDLALGKGNFEEAEFRYQEGLQAADPQTKASLMLALARLNEESGRTDAAADLYQEIAQAYPDAPEPVLRLRALAVAAGNAEEALKWQGVLDERFPDLDDREQGTWRLGLRYELARQEFERGALRNALALVKNILRIHAAFTPACLLAGDIQQKLGNESAAMRAWEKGFEATRNPVFLQRVSEALLLQDQPDRAVEYFHRAARENPGSPAIEFCMGDLYLKLEMSREALQVFERLHARYPDWMLNTRSLAELYRKTGEFKNSAELFRAVADRAAGVLPWVCYNCNTTYDVYAGYCNECHEWDTIQCNTNEAVGMTMDEKNTAYPY